MERFDLRGSRAPWAASVLALVACSRSQPALSLCEVAFGGRAYALAIPWCDAALARGDALAEATLAQAHYYAGQREAAARVAYRVLEGRAAGTGHRVLGLIAHDEGAYDRAIDHLERALRLHWYWEPAQRAMDAHTLAGAHRDAGYPQASLEAADQAIRTARAAGLRDRQRAAEVARCDVLLRMGETRRAEDALLDLLDRAEDDCQQVWPSFELGTLRSAPKPKIARTHFEAAARMSATCPNPLTASSLEKNLAWLDYVDGKHAGALERLEPFEDTVSTLLIRARIAAHRGELVAAAGYLKRAADPYEADWQWEIDLLQAQVAEAGDGGARAAVAEGAYRRSIAQIGKLRRGSPMSDAFAVGRFRSPYDGLIALLAAQGRWRDVLDVVLELDAGDMLGSTRESGTTAARRARGDKPTVDAVVEAWRGRALVIVIAATPREIDSGDERVYRVQVEDGRVDGAVLVGAAQARLWADRLYASRGDLDAARGLGALVVPSTASDQTLHVALLGALGRTPLAALRDDDGGLVIARRPLARVISLRPRARRPRAATAAVVLADPGRDLPAAAREGAQVAGLLGVDVIQRAAATSERLWSARDADVLHIAAHVGDSERGPELRLADRSITPAEIVEAGLAPRLAVLASCGAAAANDDEGWGSLAAALLHAGSDVVIASDRSVQDEDALALVERFYADPRWRDDPARALAAAQVALAAHPPRDTWGAFVARADRRGRAPPDDWAAFTALAAPPEVRP